MNIIYPDICQRSEKYSSYNVPRANCRSAINRSFDRISERFVIPARATGILPVAFIRARIKFQMDRKTYTTH
jgi:hypothetical protein